MLISYNIFTVICNEELGLRTIRYHFYMILAHHSIRSYHLYVEARFQTVMT
jgi:hypothetical protein